MLKLKIYDIGETQRSRKIDANCNGLHCIAFESSLWPKEDKQLTDGVQETFLDEEESEAQEAEARDAIVMEDWEWGLEAKKAIREFEDQEQLMTVDGEVVDLDIDDPEQEMCEWVGEWVTKYHYQVVQKMIPQHGAKISAKYY